MEQICPRRTGNSLRETLKNRLNRKKQMTGNSDALRHSPVNWKQFAEFVCRLRERIAKTVTDMKIKITVGAFPTGTPLEELEPYGWKHACTVLRGKGARKGS